MIYRYPLSRYLPTFDFFSWLVQVKAAGASAIAIDDSNARSDKWTPAQVAARTASILRPGPALAGLPLADADAAQPIGPHPDLANLVAWVKAGKRIATLVSAQPPGNAVYTVTLRRTSRSPERDSNETAWRRFAGEINAAVIDDYDDHPIALHDRMALYAGAAMNYFVVSGPAHLCMLGGYPCRVFDAQKSSDTLRRNGIAHGENFPWAWPDQVLVWEPDDYDVLARHFDAWAKADAHV